jgi:hypothetical protein
MSWNVLECRNISWYPSVDENGDGCFRKMAPITRLRVRHDLDLEDEVFVVTYSHRHHTFAIKAPACHGSYHLRTLGRNEFCQHMVELFKSDAESLLDLMIEQITGG